MPRDFLSLLLRLKVLDSSSRTLGIQAEARRVLDGVSQQEFRQLGTLPEIGPKSFLDETLLLGPLKPP